MANSDRPAHILILAAGRGQRMGGPKALMLVGNNPWWQWQTERLACTGLPTTWVISEDVARAGAPLGRTVRADATAPMFDSIRAGWLSLSPQDLAGGLFILPVDVPAPSREVWARLAKSTSPAAPTYQARRGHPVFLPAAWIASHPFPASGRLDDLIRDELREVAVTDPDIGVNLNTPADVERWLAANRGAATA